MLKRFFVGITGLLGFAIFLTAGAIGAKAETPWDAGRKSTCRDIASSNNSPTLLAGVTFTWLAGYRDGLAALAALDPRLKTVGFDKLLLEVVAICKVHPELAVAEVATDVLQFYINAQPGVLIELALPRSQ
jgi:hypothetical protein